MTSFWDYENAYAGETAWVIGSGKTLDYVPNNFFHDKLVIATNMTFVDRLRNGFVCSNYWVDVESWGTLTVMPEERRVPEHIQMTKAVSKNAIYVPTIPQKYAAFNPDVDWPDRGTFVVGPSSIHLSLHWASWLGVSHIVLVGADCGFIDEENNFADYYDDLETDLTVAHAHHVLWESVLTSMAVKLRGFGVSVHSLNPWVTLNLEGHVWSQK